MFPIVGRATSQLVCEDVCVLSLGIAECVSRERRVQTEGEMAVRVLLGGSTRNAEATAHRTAYVQCVSKTD